jgi:maleate isomerase
MAFSCWRGIVGLVRPTMRPGPLEELVRLLPDGIGLIPLANDIRRGTREELEAVMDGFEARIAELAEQDVDLLHPSGAPPFMVLGYEAERKKIRDWERKYRRPVFTSGTNQIAALTALKVRKFVGITYFAGDINATFARYFADAGFDVLAMEGMDVRFEQAGSLSSHEVYAFAKRLFLANRGAQGIYLLGPGWRTLDIIETLENDLQVPVLHAVPAQSWEIQKRLHVSEPRTGFGRLLAEMP